MMVYGLLVRVQAIPPNSDLVFEVRGAHRREFCDFTDITSPSMLKYLLKGEGGAVE